MIWYKTLGKTRLCKYFALSASLTNGTKNHFVKVPPLTCSNWPRDHVFVTCSDWPRGLWHVLIDYVVCDMFWLTMCLWHVLIDHMTMRLWHVLIDHVVCDMFWLTTCLWHVLIDHVFVTCSDWPCVCDMFWLTTWFVLQGISVERICSVLRNLPYLQKVAMNYSLIILCDVTTHDPNSIEVIVVSLVVPNSACTDTMFEGLPSTPEHQC